MTKRQLRYLKKHTGEIDADSLFGKELKMFKYFVKLGYYRPQKSVQVLTPQASNIYYMTEEGRAAIEEADTSAFRFWFPVILSNVIAFAALVIATLAYIKQ